MFSGVFTSLSAWGQDAKNRQVDQGAYQALMLASGKRIDPELERRVAAYEKHFVAKEAAYANYRDHTIRVLKDNSSFTDDEKRIKISKIENQYQKRSWNLVRKYREPVNDRLIELTNTGLSQTERVKAGMGKKLYIEQTIIENGQEKKILVRNPDHSGSMSDTDTQAGTKGIDRMAKIAEAHDIKVIRSGNTVDMPEIKHTVNRHANEFNDKVGNSSYEARLYADARNEERFLFVGIDQNDASLAGMRQAVEKHDHMKKAAVGIKLANENPNLLLQQENREKFQMFGKSTRKMTSNISDAEIIAVMKKNNMSGTVETYKKDLAEIHNRNWSEHGVTDKNIDAWYKTSRDIQELSIKKANQLAASDKERNEADLQRLSQSLKNQELTDDEKRRLTKQYVERKSSMLDADERLKQTRNALDEKLGKGQTKSSDFKKPAIFSDIPSKATIRKKIEAAAGKNFKRVGKGMGYYGKVNKAYSVVTLLQKGEAKELAAFAYQEAKDEISDRFKEKLVPGYGNMKMAFDVGWGTGRLIGENVRLGSGGPTVDEVAEKQMFNLYDAVSGNRQLKWSQEREGAYQDYFMEQMAENPGAIPQGMTASQAFALAKEKAGTGGNFFDEVDSILNEGDEARRKAKSDAVAARNKQLIEAAYITNLERDALDLGLSPYDLSGKTIAELKSMIKARKAKIAWLEKDETAWDKARALDTQEAYVDYASKFSGGANAELAWELANERGKEIMDRAIAQAEARLQAEKEAQQQYNFDEDDSSDAVDKFRSIMASAKDKSNNPVSNNLSSETEDIFDQGVTAQKKYDDIVAYVEKTERETAEIWRKIREDDARRAEKKAKSKQFWGDLFGAFALATREYAEQRNTNSPSSYEEVYEEDDTPNFNSIELNSGSNNSSENSTEDKPESSWRTDQVEINCYNKDTNNNSKGYYRGFANRKPDSSRTVPVNLCGATYYASSWLAEKINSRKCSKKLIVNFYQSKIGEKTCPN